MFRVVLVNRGQNDRVSGGRVEPVQNLEDTEFHKEWIGTAAESQSTAAEEGAG